MPTPKSSLKNVKFEAALEELESIIELVDNEQIPLEDLISRFERGAKLVTHCKSLLGEAEKRIKLIEIKTSNEKITKELEETPALGNDSSASDDLIDDDNIELF